MQQFRPIPLFQQFDVVDTTEGQLTEDNFISDAIPQPITTSPLILFPAVTTEQLSAISVAPPNTSGNLSLTAALQSTMTPDSPNRLVVIPGSRKREQPAPEETLPGQRMSPRLRHGIILSTILFVFITTLSTLIPLAAGQSASPIFSSIGNLVYAEQITWQIQAHLGGGNTTTAPSNAPVTVQNNPAPPPPMLLPTSQYIAIAQQDATAAGISPDYFVRQINAESGFNPSAVSPAGAVGIAQFEPGTAASLGINPWDPIQALRGAAQLMAGYANHYGGNYAMALAAYNGGSGTVQYAVNSCGSNWMNCLPGETRHYIYQIMGI